jgi:hypothetical protein
MNRFYKVTFSVPEHVNEAWLRAYTSHATDAFGAKVIAVEDVGHDEMPDRCELTPDLFPEGEA